MSCLCFAQEMKPPKKPRLSRYMEVSKVLLEDQTSTYKYIDVNFTCHNFARTLYLQRSSVVKDLSAYDLPGMKEDWGHEVVREESTTKIPLYMVNLVNEKTGFYHTVNAILVDAQNPKALSSYIFIEPQTDEIFETVAELYHRYAGYFDETEEGRSMMVDIGLFTQFKNNGFIYQSTDETIFKDAYSPYSASSDNSLTNFAIFAPSADE